MMQLNQKISDCCRAKDGTRMLCHIRSYPSTRRKQGHNILETLMGALDGTPIPPQPQSE